MGGVSAVLARLVVPARLAKMCQNVRALPNVRGRRHFDPFFLEKSTNLTRLISVLSLPFKFV